MEIVSEERPKNTQQLLTIARKFFKNASTFREYIGELNAWIQTSNEGVGLRLPQQSEDPALARLVDKLYVGWPSGKTFPSGLKNGVELRSVPAVSMDQIIEDVIKTVLRKCPSWSVQKRNILCCGFTLGRELGTASVFRNLDIRSPSTQIQTLRTPLWNRLLRILGHVLFRHVLLNSTLLLSIREEFNEQHYSPALVFLQLCGPLPASCEPRKGSIPFKSLSNVGVKQDLLYGDPKRRSAPASRRNATTKGQVRENTCPLPFNDGLPKSHHLQGLSADARSARHIISGIFRFSSAARDSTTVNDGRYQKELRKYVNEVISKKLDVTKDRRGRAWLREKKKQFRRLSGAIPIFERVIKRTHRFSFRRMLGRNHPLPHEWHKMKRNDNISCRDLIDLSLSEKSVAKFLVACTRQMFPSSLFGSKLNRIVLEKAIHCFVRRRLQWETFDIWRFCITAGIKITDIPWLYLHGNKGKRIVNPTDLQFRKERVKEVLSWVLRGILLPLLHQNFYVTERDGCRNRLYFFRREVWIRMVDMSLNCALTAEKKIKILSKEALSESISRRSRVLSALGNHLYPYPVLQFHNLRFVPKKSSMRLIQKPYCRAFRGFSKPRSLAGGHAREDFRSTKKKRSSDLVKASASMRKVFRHILKILMTESNVGPHVLGASVFSLDDIYSKILSLKQKWLRLKRPSLYVVGVDITTSFDTIPLKILLSNVVPSLLRRERYACIRYVVSKSSMIRGGLRQNARIHVCSEPGEEASFLRIVRQKLAGDNGGSIFTDAVHSTALTREEIMTILEEFLLNNIIAVPRRIRSSTDTGFALQSRGLPQGHILSSLLTSLFYGYVENRELSDFRTSLRSTESSERIFRKNELGRPHTILREDTELSLLMRQVDDTVFISSSKEKANDFMGRMVKGWEASYGFRINASKTRSNFSSDFESKSAILLPWCGLTFDTTSLEVLVDYCRYNSNRHDRLRYSIFVQHDVKAGQAFARKSQACFAPKLHPLLLDGRINSRFTVALNVYQAALLACLKLCAYTVDILPTDRHLSQVVQTMLSKYVAVVFRSVFSRAAIRASCKFPLAETEVRYITTHAFQRVITKRLSIRRKMKVRVKQCLEMLEKELNDFPQETSQTKSSSFRALVQRICNSHCDSLWAVRL